MNFHEGIFPINKHPSKEIENHHQPRSHTLFWSLNPVTLYGLFFSIEICSSLYKNVSKFGKFSSGHRTGKGQFSFQLQRKAMPKNAQTTAQLHSSHTLVR